jgi:hypothetical protein
MKGALLAPRITGTRSILSFKIRKKKEKQHGEREKKISDKIHSITHIKL